MDLSSIRITSRITSEALPTRSCAFVISDFCP
jgi:hypothetical protein